MCIRDSAGLARHLAIECISNKEQGPLEAAKLSLKAINVKAVSYTHLRAHETARHLAIECISNKDQGPLEAAKLSLKALNVKVGDGVNSIPLIKLITNSQILELEEILESFF